MDRGTGCEGMIGAGVMVGGVIVIFRGGGWCGSSRDVRHWSALFPPCNVRRGKTVQRVLGR